MQLRFTMTGFFHVKVSEYPHHEGRLAYPLKADDEDCCYRRFSKNLPLFGRGPWNAEATPAAGDRRRLRHIQGPITTSFHIPNRAVMDWGYCGLSPEATKVNLVHFL